MSPVNRFSMDMQFINFLPPNEAHDELFYAEETRGVRKDNTFPFKGSRYETPAHLSSKTITIRYRGSGSEAVTSRKVGNISKNMW